MNKFFRAQLTITCQCPKATQLLNYFGFINNKKKNCKTLLTFETPSLVEMPNPKGRPTHSTERRPARAAVLTAYNSPFHKSRIKT